MRSRPHPMSCTCRADELGAARRYVVAELPRDGCADLVHTGKGTLIRMPDLPVRAEDAARLLRPGGTLFVHQAHPAVPLWTWGRRRAAEST